MPKVKKRTTTRKRYSTIRRGDSFDRAIRGEKVGYRRLKRKIRKRK